MSDVPVIRSTDDIVYQMLKKGVNPRSIARQRETNESSVFRALRRLQELKLIEKGGHGRYRILDGVYLVEADPANPPAVKGIQKLKKGDTAEPYPGVTLTPAEKEFLRREHDRLPRSEIAARLRRPRYVICREAIAMGLVPVQWEECE